MQELSSYRNGNTNVSIFSDGTKIRNCDGVPMPEHLESADVKITNYCRPTEGNPICAFCHEKSGLNGKHADLEELYEQLSILPAGVELALGGGETLSHPNLIPFLVKLKEIGIICNITTNQKHLAASKDLLLSLIENDLVKGIGISYSDSKYLPDIKPILAASDNVVFHLIMGINVVSDVDFLLEACKSNGRCCKILFLGYKQFGFGINYYIKNKSIEANKYRWFVDLATHFKRDNLILSFDNLAIEQLKLKRYFTEDAWSKFYMGNDGAYSMYIDAVNKQYARSSTSFNRVGYQNIIEYFKENRVAAK